MAVNLSYSNGLYEYSEVIPTTENGKAILLPSKINKNSPLVCTIIAGSNTGKIQFTSSSSENVLVNNAVWQDWPFGIITGTVYDTLEGSVTALRGVSILGEIKIELRG